MEPLAWRWVSLDLRVTEKTENNLSYKAPTPVKVATAIGALAGSGAYIMSLAKHRAGKNVFQKISNVELGIKEGIMLCGTSVAGGLIPGLITDDKKYAKAKLHETSHQFVGNGLIPFSCLAIVNKLTKPLSKPIRTIMAVSTLFASTFLGHSVTDKMLNTPNSYKVSLIDFLPDVDDWVLAASTVLKSKSLYKFTSMVCPFTYAMLGYRVGCRQDNEKKLDKYV